MARIDAYTYPTDEVPCLAWNMPEVLKYILVFDWSDGSKVAHAGRQRGLALTPVVTGRGSAMVCPVIEIHMVARARLKSTLVWKQRICKT